jgi:hypothetical protein
MVFRRADSRASAAECTGLEEVSTLEVWAAASTVVVAVFTAVAVVLTAVVAVIVNLHS